MRVVRLITAKSVEEIVLRCGGAGGVRARARVVTLCGVSGAHSGSFCLPAT